MKKNILFSLAATLVICIVAMCGLTSCTNEDNVDKKQPVNEARTYTVSIPATIGGGSETRAVEFGTSAITAKFLTTDEIRAYYYDGSSWQSAGILQPDAEGTNANLTGTLTGVSVGSNNLMLCYGLPSTGIYIYNGQDGSASSAASMDFATATVSVTAISGTDVTTSGASFENLQSMFRQRLTFKSGSATVNPTIVYFMAQTDNGGHTNTTLNPLSGTGSNGPVTLSSPTITSDGDIYFAMNFNSSLLSTEGMIFRAFDSDGNQYEATKAAPTGGFQNGKYYYGSLTLTRISSGKALTSVTSSDVGWVIGDDGIAYDPAYAMPIGVTPMAMIAYVPTSGSKMAISLEDESSGGYYNFDYSNSNTIVIGKTAIPSCGAWMIPTATQWQYALNGSGAGILTVTESPSIGAYINSSGLNANLTAAGGQPLSDYYWTQTHHTSDLYLMYFDSTGASFQSSDDAQYWKIRPVFNF